MKKTKLKQLIKEAFLTEQKNNLLNEGAPGFDSRKQGEALPTLESIKAAYQAKKLEEAGVEEITTVTKMTKPAEAAEIAKAEGTPKTTVDAAIKKAKTSGKDVSIAEDTLEEDRFVDSSLEDLEQVVRNLAHTAGMGIEEAAEMAINHIQDMFSEEELDEGVEKDYWADYTDIGLFYIGIDAKHSLSDQQLEKLGEKIVKQLYGGDVGKAYDDIVRGKKRGSGADLAEREEDDYDPGALAKVGESTTNGIVVKNTKLPSGKVEVEYESGDVQVLEKENGVWVEVDYRKASLEEAKMDKEFKQMYAADRKSKELIRIANELFPDIAAKQEGGKLVNFIPLSNEQRDEVYAEYAKLNEEEIAEATELPKDIEWEFDDVIDQMDAYNATISLTGHSESTGKDYTASAEASRGGSGGDWDWMEVDEVEEEPINESVITKADKIVESFRK